MLIGGGANAAYLLEIDTDGADDGVLSFNSGFSFGGDTTTASQSSPASAFGLTGGDSIFGGDGGAEPDTYVYTYNPSVDGDNLSAPAGTDLGDGNTATGIAAGTPGTYAVYATWPFTVNVSGGDTSFTIATDGVADVTTLIDQNNGTDGLGNVWVKVGEIDYTSGDIVVTQQPSVANSFRFNASIRCAVRTSTRTECCDSWSDRLSRAHWISAKKANASGEFFASYCFTSSST